LEEKIKRREKKYEERNGDKKEEKIACRAFVSIFKKVPLHNPSSSCFPVRNDKMKMKSLGGGIVFFCIRNPSKFLHPHLINNTNLQNFAGW